VVNGGTLYRPQMVHSITAPNGKILKTFSPISEGKILGSAHSLGLIRNALVGVVNSPGGTAKAVALPDVLIGGKTGTAQVVRLSHVEGMSEKAIPYKYRDHAWFTAFAPAEKPEIAVTVLVEHGQHGGSAAGPVAKAVFKKYFELKNGNGNLTAAEETPLPVAPEKKEEYDAAL
jgi:penicillin-binding protein 2